MNKFLETQVNSKAAQLSADDTYDVYGVMDMVPRIMADSAYREGRPLGLVSTLICAISAFICVQIFVSSAKR